MLVYFFLLFFLFILIFISPHASLNPMINMCGILFNVHFSFVRSLSSLIISRICVCFFFSFWFLLLLFCSSVVHILHLISWQNVFFFRIHSHRCDCVPVSYRPDFFFLLVAINFLHIPQFNFFFLHSCVCMCCFVNAAKWCELFLWKQSLCTGG